MWAQIFLRQFIKFWHKRAILCAPTVVPKSPTHTGLICVKITATNFSCLKLLLDLFYRGFLVLYTQWLWTYSKAVVRKKQTDQNKYPVEVHTRGPGWIVYGYFVQHPRSWRLCWQSSSSLGRYIHRFPFLLTYFMFMYENKIRHCRFICKTLEYKAYSRVQWFWLFSHFEV
jgi:hypothetical protein